MAATSLLVRQSAALRHMGGTTLLLCEAERGPAIVRLIARSKYQDSRLTLVPIRRVEHQ